MKIISPCYSYFDPLTHFHVPKHLFKKICVLTKIDKFEQALYLKYRTILFLAKRLTSENAQLTREILWIHEILIWLKHHAFWL